MFLSYIALVATTSLSTPPVDQSLHPNSSIEFLTPKNPSDSSKTKVETTSFEPFTGKITGSKVRLRLQPNLDGVILKEFTLGDLVVVTGEFDDFYAIRPESKYKGYVYRTYVLDNIVEASNVNLRLEPDTKAPVLTQLGQGDTINCTICPDNNKWLMVDLPDTVRFYVAKDYVTRLGDAMLYDRLEARRQTITTRLAELDIAIKQELQKDFHNIQLLAFVNELKTVAEQNQDLPTLAEQAQALIRSTQEEYLAHSKTTPHIALMTETAPSLEKSDLPPMLQIETKPTPHYASFALEQQENYLLEQALQSGKATSREIFYADEVRIAQELMGQIVPYDRIVKGRPGDFMLVEAKTKVPVAYLYSSRIDLSNYVGQMVRITVADRPNHHFALPAYFVHDLKKW